MTALAPVPSPVRLDKTLQHDGCTLHYTVGHPAGDPAATPVLLIQGVGVHGNGWLPQADALAPYYRTLTFDNRGMGKSLPLTGPLTVERMAADALALLDAENIGSAHIVGHSLGGLVAQHLALTARGRVRSLCLMCTFSRGADATKLTWKMLLLGTRSRIGPRAARRRAFLQIILPPEQLQAINPEQYAAELAPLFGHDLADQPPIVMKQLDALKRYDATPRLHELAGICTLILAGRHDPIARPSTTRALAAALPHARYKEFENASHGLPLHLSRETNTLLLEHLHSVDER